jgi:quercetin dioxygenase-like cupin family protein
MTETTILRKPLLKATLPKKQVTAVDVREIRFQPNQQTGRHKHPCPVIGYIAEGSAVLQIEGQPPQQLPTGSAFYEPADVIITRFDNASATAPMKPNISSMAISRSSKCFEANRESPFESF